jgi:uncharacterized 2Fe-2S/4Fe-4S cluster protein (DUF4445 family)
MTAPIHSSAAHHQLHFAQLERAIDSAPDETLYQSARRHGVRIVGACGGRGICGSCMVSVTQGEVSRVHALRGDVNDGEVLASDGRMRPWLRACQVSARSDCNVEIAARSLAPVVRAEALAEQAEQLAVDAMLCAVDLQLAAASLADPTPDVARVLHALAPAELSVDLLAMQQLPARLRQSGPAADGGDWSLRAWMRGREVIAFSPWGQRALGLAVDLGTTNVAAFLLDLGTGERLASLGIENPQVVWGADLISRINHAIQSPQAARELQRAAVESINVLAHDLCQTLGYHSADILDLVVCGNTAMHHLLLGLPVRQLGRAPFVAVLGDAISIKARDIGLNCAVGAFVHLAPNVGGFVGGDHVTALLATEPQWQGLDTALLMDIGTNTEITLIHQGQFYSASAPSGPALEGGHISCGMRAAEGAIERIGLDHGRLVVETIADKKAIGLCGSGVLDAVASLLRGGLMNPQGRLSADHPDIMTLGKQRAVRLAPEVFFTQGDVRAVQLAKAAIRTATELLLDLAGVPEAAIQRFIIAGAFGAYIDVQSGIDTGLFADLPRERFVQVGNAAGVGVRQMLVSGQTRRGAAALAQRCRYVELSSRSDFQKVFLHHIAFPKTVPGHLQ